MSTALPRPQLILNDDPKAALPVVRGLARIMDKAITLPGTNVSVGLDALLGFFPGIGDTISSVIGSYIIVVAHRLGAPTTVIVRMVLNQVVDGLIGIVPFAGDLLDIGWKSNVRNVNLLEQTLADPQRARRASTWVVVGLLAAMFALGAATAALGWYLLHLIRGA
jgi:hypothetical protein